MLEGDTSHKGGLELEEYVGHMAVTFRRWNGMNMLYIIYGVCVRVRACRCVRACVCVCVRVCACVCVPREKQN